VGIICFSGCQDVKLPEEPENLIPEEKMVDILAEVYINNAARSINNRVIRSKGIKLDSLLYQKYQVDSVQFAQSNAYYTSQLNKYNDLFVQVEERLVILQNEKDSIKESKDNSKKVAVRRDSTQRDTTKTVPGLIKPEETHPHQDPEE